MTQTPQPNDAPGTAEAQGDGEAPAPSFKPILRDQTPKEPPRKLLIIVGVAIVVITAGLIFCRGKPDDAEAKAPVLDFSKMTAEELAKNAGVPAARELARRMVSGTPSERVAASSAINCWRTPRLTRNLAMAMALATQKKSHDMNVRMARDQQIARDGPPPRSPGW